MLCSALPRPASLCVLVLSTVLASGCDEPAKPAGGAGSATAAAASAAPPPAPAPKPASMPDVIVDAEGPYISGTRINMADPTGPEKLVKVVKDLPIQGNPVTVQADRKAKIPYVAAVVGALGDAGAPKIVIKTDGRNDLPKELTVIPQEKVSSPASCSIVVMVLKDLSTAIWPLKGGLGKRQRKGLAGPDLSRTGEQLEKELAACDSPVAFFSSDESVAWELAFNLAGTVLVSDKKKKIDTLVLLREEPVAGRAVTLGKH